MNDKILIADDEELNRELLTQIFEDEYEIITACDGNEALVKFEKNIDSVKAILLDLVMPNADGYHVLRVLSMWRETAAIPIILITANSDAETAIRCYKLGAAEIINKPFVASIVRQRVDNMIELYSSREALRQDLDVSLRKLAERDKQLQKFNSNFIDTISNVVEFRDLDSGQHITRVKGLTRIIASTYARLYPDSGLTPDNIDIIEKQAALHDIGKIAIPDAILLKPGRFTPEERAVMETHTTRGCDILKKLENVQDAEHYRAAYEIIRHHHERFDGRGYPDKLKGDEIPLSARLVSIADVYDALTSKRVYKEAYGKDTAYQMILNDECGVFDPRLLKCLEESKRIMELFAESTRD